MSRNSCRAIRRAREKAKVVSAPAPKKASVPVRAKTPAKSRAKTNRKKVSKSE